VALLQSEVDTAKQWMARVLCPVMGRGEDAWAEGGRKYLLVPLRESTPPTPLPAHGRSGQSAGTAELLLSFLNWRVFSPGFLIQRGFSV
jgi:hypothetical protein